MIKLSVEKVLLLHKYLIEETGGDPNVRDINLLDQSLEHIYQTFDGKELYKTKEEKAARLGFSLVTNHAFIDGNKRIGMYIMLTFLEVNGINVLFTDEEIVSIGFKLATGKMQYEELVQEIIKYRL